MLKGLSFLLFLVLFVFILFVSGSRLTFSVVLFLFLGFGVWCEC